MTPCLSCNFWQKSSDSANIVQDDTVMYSQDNLLHFAELYGFILGNIVLLGTPYKIEYRCTTYKNSSYYLIVTCRDLHMQDIITNILYHS